jgi:TRAP-type C4-dicarboxylate transport system permease small subunit
MLAPLRRLADRLTEAAAVVVLLALLGSVVLGVISRALNEPVVWSDELARYLMVWLALIGWTLATRRRAHIRITIVLDRLPMTAWRAVEAAIQAALAVFGALLVRDGLTLVDRNLDIEAVSMPLPAALLYVPILFAGLATSLQALAQALEVLTGQPASGAPTTAGKIL